MLEIFVEPARLLLHECTIMDDDRQSLCCFSSLAISRTHVTDSLLGLYTSETKCIRNWVSETLHTPESDKIRVSIRPRSVKREVVDSSIYSRIGFSGNLLVDFICSYHHDASIEFNSIPAEHLRTTKLPTAI